MTLINDEIRVKFVFNKKEVTILFFKELFVKIAFVLYNELNYLDFFGFYDVVTRVKTLGIDEDLKWKICSLRDEIRDDKNLFIRPDTIGESLDGFDLVFIPGGIGSKTLMYDDIFLSWIKGSRNSKYKVSVCEGSLLFGAAGLIKDKEVATSKKTLELLKPYCSEVIEQRFVEDNGFISGGGASCGLDVGLYVIEKFYGKKAKEYIRSEILYPYF